VRRRPTAHKAVRKESRCPVWRNLLQLRKREFY
jgi:hypothetical protein